MIQKQITHFHLFPGSGGGQCADAQSAPPAMKVRARKLLNRAVTAGKITPQPCEQCNATKTEGHHDDYSKPLEVRWLCPKCHAALHKQKHPIIKKCEACGATFAPQPTKRARAKSCSPACRNLLISRKKIAAPTIPPWAKLNGKSAEEIRVKYAAGGRTLRSLSEEYGVHHKQIGEIVKGRAWK